jgi:ParB family chromosome partitioning protein
MVPMDVKITEIRLEELHPPDFHLFQVSDDDSMKMLVESVRQYGVREPGLARIRDDGGYELLCGNRRKRACEIAEIPTMPVIIRELDDNNAVIAMVDSNLQQRDKLLFSEKAWAYRVKMEALKSAYGEREGYSWQVMVEQSGESKNQIYRLIRLTELIPALMDKVDSRRLAFNPAVELSYLSRKEQAAVVDAMAKYQVKPSLSQAVRLKKMKQYGMLSVEMIESVLAEVKEQSEAKDNTRFSSFFPQSYSPKQMEAVIIRLLTEWKGAKT